MQPHPPAESPKRNSGDGTRREHGGNAPEKCHRTSNRGSIRRGPAGSGERPSRMTGANDRPIWPQAAKSHEYLTLCTVAVRPAGALPHPSLPAGGLHGRRQPFPRQEAGLSSHAMSLVGSSCLYGYAAVQLVAGFIVARLGAGNRAHGVFPPDAHLSWAERPKKSEMNQTFQAVPGASPQPGRTRRTAFPRSSAGRCPSGDAIPVPPECESRRRPQRARGRRDGPGESPAGGGNPSFVKNNTLCGTKIDALMNRNVQGKSESAFPSAAARIKPF